MELKKTKQPIMGIAALLIIFYHLFPCHTDYRARTADFRTLGCGLHP